VTDGVTYDVADVAVGLLGDAPDGLVRLIVDASSYIVW